MIIVKHVLLAPDKFKGSLTAAEVADALAEGLAAGNPSWRITCSGSRWRRRNGRGRRRRRLDARRGEDHRADESARPTSYAIRGSTAVVELASAVGLVNLPGGALDPLGASTFGLGTVIRHALDGGAREIIVGLGGSASTDGGAGMLQALGAAFSMPETTSRTAGGTAPRRPSGSERSAPGGARGAIPVSLRRRQSAARSERSHRCLRTPRARQQNSWWTWRMR